MFCNWKAGLRKSASSKKNCADTNEQRKMTKKKKVSPVRKFHYQTLSFKVEETEHKPNKSQPSNLQEEKEKFMKSGKAPKFEVKDPEKLAELAGKDRNQIRFGLLGEAEHILEKVRDQYGQGEHFLEHMFGLRIEKEEATPKLLEYIEENSLNESIRIHWSDNMPCSAKMMWTGPVVNANRPELRKYSLWINGSDDNNYMRESGIKCLMDHELGTHFFRMLNDGFQPWFSEHGRFGLRPLGGMEQRVTEEGLATIHTVLRGRVKLLWSAAMAYYCACKAAEMSFKELYDHLGRYLHNPDARWKQVMRVKRGLADPNDLGGFGNDQCYFEGAVAILRNIDSIDFSLLMSGKICWDEISRIKRVVRRDAVKLPVFMRDMNAYVKSLRKMAELNNLGDFHMPRKPPSAYLKRLSERQAAGGFGKKPKKVRSSDRLKQKGGKRMRSKDKNSSNKKDAVESSSEVKSFPVSSRFENPQESQARLEEHQRLKTKDEDRVIALAETLASQIRSIDSRPSIDEEINQCKNLICEHSWSSEEYRDTVFSQASSEPCATDISEENQSQTDGDENSVLPDDASEVNKLQSSLGKSGVPQSCREPPWPRASISSETFEITGDGLNIQERPWTVGVGMTRADSPRGLVDSSSMSNSCMLDSSNNKTKQHTKSVDSVELRKDIRAKAINLSLPFQSQLESSWRGCFDDNSSQPQRSSTIPTDPSVASSEAPFQYEWEGEESEEIKKMAMRAETGSRGLGLMRQRQLLHPSVARLTTRSDLHSKVSQVKGKLRSIQRQVNRLQGAEANNNSAATHLESFLCDFSDNLITSPFLPSKTPQPLPPPAPTDHHEFQSLPVDHLQAFFSGDFIDSPLMHDAVTAATCASMINKPPHRRSGFRSRHHHHHLHHQQQQQQKQQQQYLDLKPIPLYSDLTLAAAKLEASRTGSSIVTPDTIPALQPPVAPHPVKRILYTPVASAGMQPTVSMEALRRQRLLHGRRQARH